MRKQGATKRKGKLWNVPHSLFSVSFSHFINKKKAVVDGKVREKEIYTFTAESGRVPVGRPGSAGLTAGRVDRSTPVVSGSILRWGPPNRIPSHAGFLSLFLLASWLFVERWTDEVCAWLWARKERSDTGEWKNASKWTHFELLIYDYQLKLISFVWIIALFSVRWPEQILSPCMEIWVGYHEMLFFAMYICTMDWLYSW